MKKIDLLYRNSGKALANTTQQNALSIGRTNAKDFSNVPPLMSPEGAALAKNTAPRSAYEVVGVDDRTRMSLSDTEPEMWRRFQPGDATPWDNPEEEDPNHKLFTTNERGEYEEEDPDLRRQIDEQEPHEGYDDEEEEEMAANESLARTENAFDRQRLFRAIDRLTKRTKKRLVRGHDGRSYARDGRSYSLSHGCLGGVTEWNALFRQGEIV